MPIASTLADHMQGVTDASRGVMWGVAYIFAGMLILSAACKYAQSRGWL